MRIIYSQIMCLVFLFRNNPHILNSKMMINFAFSMLQLKNISRMTRKVTGIDVKNCFAITY